MTATLTAKETETRQDPTRLEPQGRREADLLAAINASLHTMSQPMTVLLCVLEYADRLETVAEMKQAIGSGIDACARLSATVCDMQAQVRRGMER